MKGGKALDIGKVSWQTCWERAMGWDDPRIVAGRKGDDDLEEAFWQKMAPRYYETNNLPQNIPELWQALEDIIEPNSTILEIGPGSGNFTILLAKKSRCIVGVEPSVAMRQAAIQLLARNGIDNVVFHSQRWENYVVEKPIDYILSVNSLYRIKDIEKALDKMTTYRKKKAIIVRTVIRPIFYKAFTSLLDWIPRGQDYQIIPNILWSKGYWADITNICQCHTKFFTTWSDVESVIDQECEVYGIQLRDRNDFMSKLAALLTEEADGFTYTYERIYTIIRW